MSLSNLLARLSFVRTAWTGTLAVLVWAISTAKYWLNSDASNATYWLILYISDRFGPELMILALVFTLLVIPQSFHRKVAHRFGLYFSNVISDFSHIRDRNWTVPVLVRTVSLAIILISAIIFFSGIAQRSGTLVYNRGAFFLKYSQSDLLNYLNKNAQYQIETLHYIRARSIYKVALEIYGKDERTNNISRELIKLDRFRSYAIASVVRAEELERTFGPNRTSMYLYISALPLIPDDETIVRKVSIYGDILKSIRLMNDRFSEFCADERRKEIEAFTSDEFSRLTGFFGSREVRIAMDPEKFLSPVDRKVLLCSHHLRFGPILHEMNSERVGIAKLIKAFESTKRIGLDEEKMAPYR